MSTHEKLPTSSAHASNDGHDDFDPEPASSLPPDERPSPLWLPVLGVCVLVAVGAFLFATADDEDAASGASSAVATAEAAPQPARPPAERARPTMRRPAPGGATGRPRLRPIRPPADRR